MKKRLLIIAFFIISIACISYLIHNSNKTKIAILGDSLSEPGGVNAPTTSKYWYEFLDDDLNIDYKTYAFSGNQWTDVLQQAQRAYRDQEQGGFKYDVIILFAGTNDFYFDVPIGNFYRQLGDKRYLEYNEEYFAGRLNKTLHYVKTRFPDAEVYVCNILHRGFAHGTADEMTSNKSGFYLEEYSKMIDEATLRWSVHLIDLRRNSGMYPTPGTDKYFTNRKVDLLHANKEGHRKIERVIKNSLLEFSLNQD